LLVARTAARALLNLKGADGREIHAHRAPAQNRAKISLTADAGQPAEEPTAAILGILTFSQKRGTGEVRADALNDGGWTEDDDTGYGPDSYFAHAMAKDD
jgi:hypothetical protein